MVLFAYVLGLDDRLAAWLFRTGLNASLAGAKKTTTLPLAPLDIQRHDQDSRR